MSFKPLLIQNISIQFSSKIFLQEFTAQVAYGDRIGIIGPNGSGKSSFLKLITQELMPFEGEIKIDPETPIGYVPQVIERFDTLSGGQRFQKALTEALAAEPTLLLLDEPTNHLDGDHRRTLKRMLQAFPGTLIIVSHDPDLLNSTVEQLWAFEEGAIHCFKGTFEEYHHDLLTKRAKLEQEIAGLNAQKKATHLSLMKEQKRSKQSRLKGEKHLHQQKYPKMVSDEKARQSQETSGRKKSNIEDKKRDLVDKLARFRVPEIITPKFHFSSSSKGLKLSIQDGKVGYNSDYFILENINLSLLTSQRLALKGKNGAGKSTLLRGILGDPALKREGEWYTPSRTDIGYLDQHYKTLDPDKSVLESIQDLRPDWALAEIRSHLNDFLFRKNEEVNKRTALLSGGEKARLSLACIAANAPKILLLDEITNNLDLQTRAHVIQVLQAFPGSMIVISHDDDFLNQIGIDNFYIL